jgi:hypothetical protein
MCGGGKGFEKRDRETTPNDDHVADWMSTSLTPREGGHGGMSGHRPP